METDQLKLLEKVFLNENNENIMNFNRNKIEDDKINILNEIELSNKVKKNLLKKLKDYRFIDELKDLIIGRYIRWINIGDNENLNLKNGGIICNIEIDDLKDKINIICKNRFNNFFQLNFANSLIFQKITNQELIVLLALENI